MISSSIKLLVCLWVCGISARTRIIQPDVKQLECKMGSYYIFPDGFAHDPIGGSLCDISNANLLEDNETLKFSVRWFIFKQHEDDFREEVMAVNFNNSVVRYLPNKIFKTFPEMIMLTMDRVGLEILEVKSFERAKKLRYLTLESNNLEHLKEFTFIGARNLEFLILGYNKISYVSEEAFYGLDQLRTLDLSYNKIKILKANTLNSLVSLEKFILSSKLKVIQKDLFKNNLKLHDINLSGNEISAVEPNSFQNLKNLTILNMKFNDCTSVSFEFFSYDELSIALKKCYQNFVGFVEI